ncbi:MAG TPA: hypothetical protein VH141_04335 [Pseudonocardia sp.]|jgi:hypothetical protein|nr:hypothetical protein [Pseudonocardia sp.]
MSARLAPIAPVLAALERWRPVYLRWWDHPCRRLGGDAAGSGSGPGSASAERPWSAGEQERFDRLASTDPGALSAAADRFDAVAAELGEIGRAAGAVGAEAAVGPGAAASCTALAAAIGSEATEVTALAGELRAASTRLDVWLTELVRQVLRVGDGVWDGGAYRSSLWPAQRDAEEADAVASLVPRYPGREALELAEPAALARWARLDELAGGHGAVLAVLRAGLAAADGWDGGLGSPTGAGLWGGTDAESGPGVGPSPVPGLGSGAGSGPDRPGGAAGWLSEGPVPVPDVVVDREYRDRVLRDWRPLVPEVQSGTGPELAGVEGHRPGTDIGVRVAELPDAPPIRARPPAR